MHRLIFLLAAVFVFSHSAVSSATTYKYQGSIDGTVVKSNAIRGSTKVDYTGTPTHVDFAFDIIDSTVIGKYSISNDFGRGGTICKLPPFSNEPCGYSSFSIVNNHAFLTLSPDLMGWDIRESLTLQFDPSWLADPTLPFNGRGMLETRRWDRFDGGREFWAELTISFGADVPEPSQWAMMIGGFSIAGGALRRRRALQPRLASA